MLRCKTITASLVSVGLWFTTSGAQTNRLFLKTDGDYTELQKFQIQLVCLRIDLQEKERLKDFQFHQMAQVINQALNSSNPRDKSHIDLASLDVFNYSLASISLDEESQQIVVSILANQKFLDQKPGAEQKKFLADCFRLISQRLAKNFVDFDEYRDLVVQFYPLDFEEDPFVQYSQGEYVWSPPK